MEFVALLVGFFVGIGLVRLISRPRTKKPKIDNEATDWFGTQDPTGTRFFFDNDGRMGKVPPKK